MSSINGQLLDQYLKEGRKLNTTFVQDKIKGIILLKSAAVIGELFTLRQLEFISPLINDDLDTITDIVLDLQNRDFIEIIDDTDNKNWMCRFTKKFLRETLYQRLLLRGQKKALHQLSADYIQNHPNIEPDHEIEQKRLLNHILVAEDLKTEEKLSFKAKQALTVKKLTHILFDKKKKIVKDGFLTKQGERTNKNIEPRYVRLTRTDLQWFHNQEEAKHNDVALGSINFAAIYQVIPAKRDKVITSDIFISCNAWSKKNVEKGDRTFVFGAKTENERDEWITSIEYMRTKSVYENFTKKYANITFPIEHASHKQKKISLGSTMNKKQIDLPSQSSFFKKLPSTRKGSIMHDIINKKRLSSFSLDSYQMNNQENVIKDTANKIKTLFNVNFTYFFGQIAENVTKGSAFKGNTLGRKPECLKNVNFVKNSGIISPPNNKQSIESPSSMTSQFAKLQNTNYELKINEDPPLPEMKKFKSANVVLSNIEENLGSDLFENMPVRQSERKKPLNTIDEAVNEHDISVELDKSKIFTQEKEPAKRERAETFKPYNYKEEEKVATGKVTTSNPIKVAIPMEIETKGAIMSKQRGFEPSEHRNSQSHHSEETDEEVEKRVRDQFTSKEMSYFGLRAQSDNPKKEKSVYMFERKPKEDFLNSSEKSNSKYSGYEGENFGNNEFVVKTKNNKIPEAMIRKTNETEVVTKRGNTSKGLSISKINHFFKHKNINNDAINKQEMFPENSKENTSQQQAINMFGNAYYNEAGLRRNSPFYKNPDVPVGSGHSRSNSHSPMRAHSQVSQEGVPNGFGNMMPPFFGNSISMPNQTEPNSAPIMGTDPNQMMGNPFMMHMMQMMMQQNTAIIQQQQEFLRSTLASNLDDSSRGRDASKSRSRSRPHKHQERRRFKRHEANYDSRSQIDNVNFSELDADFDKDEENNQYEPENIRAGSVSFERQKRVNHINQMNIVHKESQPARTSRNEKGSRHKPVEPKIQDKTVGLVQQDTECQVNPNLKLQEGDIVTVERYIPELEIYQCRHKNQIGMYPKDAINIVRKKGQKINQKDEKSMERRLEALEKDAHKRNKQHKNKHGRKYRQAEDEFEDINETMKEYNYETKNSKLNSSQNEILPYNSLKQSEYYPYATPEMEEGKRLSKGGDFTKVSQSALDQYGEENSEHDESFRNKSDKIQKLYYEPGKQLNIPQKSHDESMRSGKSSRNDDAKLQKAAARKKKRQQENTKFLRPETFFEQSKPLLDPNSHHKMAAINEGEAVNDSMSSNQSSLNRSLKLQQRKQKKQSRNPLGIPVKQPKTYGAIKEMRTFNK